MTVDLVELSDDMVHAIDNAVEFVMCERNREYEGRGEPPLDMHVDRALLTLLTREFIGTVMDGISKGAFATMFDVTPAITVVDPKAERAQTHLHKEKA